MGRVNSSSPVSLCFSALVAADTTSSQAACRHGASVLYGEYVCVAPCATKQTKPQPALRLSAFLLLRHYRCNAPPLQTGSPYRRVTTLQLLEACPMQTRTCSCSKQMRYQTVMVWPHREG